MRVFVTLLTSALLLGACLAPEKQAQTLPPSATPSTTPAPTNPPGTIAVDPRILALPADEMIPGKFTIEEGSIATAQWNRAWNRDPADPGAASGVTRVAINARLYQSIKDATDEFATISAGKGGMDYVQGVIEQRGFERRNVKVTPASVGTLGAEEEAAWRAEFTRGNPNETFVQYFVFVRVRNTRALITTFAQNKDGAEAPNLLEDTKQISLRQTRRLLAFR